MADYTLVVQDTSQAQTTDNAHMLSQVTGEWFVRPSGDTYGSGNGSTYADAWAGFSNIGWDSIRSGHVLNVCGLHYETLTLEKDNVKVIGNHPAKAGVIDGSTKITGSWTLHSGDVYKIAISASDMDYTQETTPSSPSQGEKWFCTGGVLAMMMFEYSGTEWVESTTGFFEPYMLSVDGVFYNPSRFTTTGYIDGTINVTSASDTSLNKGINYWRNARAVLKHEVWRTEYRFISASSGNDITYGTLPVDNDRQDYFYIENVVDEIASLYEWAYDADDNSIYLQLPNPENHDVKVTTRNYGIYSLDKNNITIQSIEVKNCNYSGIALIRGSDNTVDGANVHDIFTGGRAPCPQAGIALIGDTTWNTRTYIGAVNSSDDRSALNVENNGEIINCTIENIVGGGHGANIYLVDYALFEKNTLINIGNDSLRVMGIETGVMAWACQYTDILNNNISYVNYAGIKNYSSYATIALNVVDESMLHTSDGGAYYHFGAITHDNIIEDNTFTNIYGNHDYVWTATLPSTGVYCDEGSDNNTVQNNIVKTLDNTLTSKGCIHLNVATNHDILNNACYSDRVTNAVIAVGGSGNTITGNTREDENQFPQASHNTRIGFDGTTGDYASTTARFDFGSADDFTIEFEFRTSQQATGCFFTQRESGTNKGISAFLRSDGTVRFNIQGTGAGQPTTSAAYDDGNWYTASCSFDRSGNALLYIDGVLKDTVNISSLGDIDHLEYWYFGRAEALYQNGGSEFNYDGELKNVRVWNDIRTVTEISTNLDTIYDGTETGLIGLWLCDEGGGTTIANQVDSDYNATLQGDYTWAVTAEVQDASQLQTANNLGLEFVVNANDTAQAQTADNLALVQNHVLVVQDTAQAQTADNTDLIQNFTLVVQDTTQAQTVDNLALTQQNILVVGDTNQAQTADNVELVQNYSLVVQGTTQAQTVDNLSLVQNYILVVGDTTQAQTADNITLGVAGVLVVQDTTQAQTADNLTLQTTDVILVVQDTTQAQTADNLTLVQSHVLAVDDTTQAQTADNIIFTFAVGLVIITFTERQPGITFTERQPTITFTEG